MAGRTYPGVAPSGDTRCPSWCQVDLCVPEICHRSDEVKVETAEATVSLSLSQWRTDPELLAPGWAPAHLSCQITHKTHQVDDGSAPEVVSASDPVALSVHFGATREELRRVIAAQSELLALLEQDGGVGDA